MEARLYELICDYLADRSRIVGGEVETFRLSAIKTFAEKHPSKYPEYLANPERLRIVVGIARREGEILAPPHGGRDDELRIRRPERRV